MIRRGTVRADGSSTLLPEGVHDMVALEAPLDVELEAQLKKLASAFTVRETEALFKLEVFFRGGCRRIADVRGVIAIWTNGGYLNGGGDAAVYLCPQPTVEGAPCLAPIDMRFATPREAVCVKCRRSSSTNDLIGQIITEVSIQRWAQILVKLFHVLDCNADLRICVERGSIRRAAALELFGDMEGEAYAAVTNKREWITYSLANIIKDTASGASLESRFRAFLEA